MPTYVTEYEQFDPVTRETVKYAGPDITAESEEKAQQWIDENAPYLVIIGTLIYEHEICLN